MAIKVPLPPWSLGTVIAVLAVRVVGGYLFGKMAGAFGLPANWLNIFDRLWLILLVVIVKYLVYGAAWKIDFKKLLSFTAAGVGAGLALFVFAQGLEKLLGFFFAADNSTHPLVQLAAQARSFREFLIPFFIGAVLAPVSEELYYRGLAYPVFKKRWGLVTGLLANGIFFAALHFNPVWLIEIILVAVALAVLYEFTGALLPGMIAHGVVNGIRLVMIYFKA